MPSSHDADDAALMTQPGDALMTHTVTQSGDVPTGSGAHDARVR